VAIGLHFYPIWEAASVDEWLHNGGPFWATLMMWFFCQYFADRLGRIENHVLPLSLFKGNYGICAHQTFLCLIRFVEKICDICIFK
jgi:hypothetical protein